MNVVQPRVVLLGAPNTGKTSLFNALTGETAQVGNYPGVTVDRREGQFIGLAPDTVLVDVPGADSLSARSAEEMITLAATLGLDGSAPDLALIVADATRPEGTLYIALQVLELGIPSVVALTMVDELQGAGPNVDALGKQLGVPVIRISSRTGEGLPVLRSTVEAAIRDPKGAYPTIVWPPAVEAATAQVVPHLPATWLARSKCPVRAAALARQAILSIDKDDELPGIPAGLRQAVETARNTAPIDLDEAIIRTRFEWLDAGRSRWGAPPTLRSLTERVDRVLLHPIAGIAIFVLLMGTLFQVLFAGADPIIGLLESLFSALAAFVQGALPAGVLTDLLVEGVIGGVGNVVAFVPQIAILFLFIGVLEASGYMARAAYLMDRVMRACGLHGRAFVPMLSGFACAVPAILATRTMERRRDRLLTMMVVPLMTCSARLPVYTLIIAALIPPGYLLGIVPTQAAVMLGMYLFSVLTALFAAAVIGRTVLRGPSVPLLLELPPYRMPRPLDIARLVSTRTKQFMREAGTAILGFTVAMWVLLSFPALSPPPGGVDSLSPDEATAWRAQALEHSAAGRMGKALEPVIAPLGFDWRIGVGLVGAFAAREVFVSTMGLVYGIGEEIDEESPALRERIRSETRPDGKPRYTPLVGASLLVFFSLAAQCMSTLAVVARETRSYRWPTFLFAYMTILAWLVSFCVYQVGLLLGFE